MLISEKCSRAVPNRRRWRPAGPARCARSIGKSRINQSRWFDPSVGRWLSEDPAAADENLYRYCGNDPTDGTDPSGLVIEKELPTKEGVVSYNGSELNKELHLVYSDKGEKHFGFVVVPTTGNDAFTATFQVAKVEDGNATDLVGIPSGMEFTHFELSWGMRARIGFKATGDKSLQYYWVQYKKMEVKKELKGKAEESPAAAWKLDGAATNDANFPNKYVDQDDTEKHLLRDTPV